MLLLKGGDINRSGGTKELHQEGGGIVWDDKEVARGDVTSDDVAWLV